MRDEFTTLPSCSKRSRSWSCHDQCEIKRHRCSMDYTPSIAVEIPEESFTTHCTKGLGDNGHSPDAPNLVPINPGAVGLTFLGDDPPYYSGVDWDINDHGSTREDEWTGGGSTGSNIMHDGPDRYGSNAPGYFCNAPELQTTTTDVSDDVKMEDLQPSTVNSVGELETLPNDTCFGMLHAAATNDLQTKIAKKANMTNLQTKVSLSFPGDLGIITSSSGDYLGLLESGMGKALSSLIQTFHIDLEPFLLKNEEAQKRRLPKNSHTVYIIIYGLRQNSNDIGCFLSRHQLFLQHPILYDFAVDYYNPQYLIHPGIEMEIPEPASSKSQLGGGKSLSKEFNEISDIFETAAGPITYSEVRDSSRLRTALKDHQKRALAMMLEKESGEIENNEFGSLWEVQYGDGPQPRYRNVVTGRSVTERPQLCLGGLLADTMGLGKTLTTLALIIHSIEKQNSYKTVSSTVLQRPTLVVAPKSALSSWQEQLERHLKPDTLKYLVYYGDRRKDLLHSGSYDLVLTTYGTLVAERRGGQKSPNKLRGLQGVEWFRVVLDEAHSIRERSTKMSQAARSLVARHRWCLTGTPIQNRIDDFFSLLQFLRVAPFDKIAQFNSCIGGPLKRGDRSALSRLVKATTLRRTKESVGHDIQLPSRVIRLEELEFSEDERRLYRFVRNRSNFLVNDCPDKSSGSTILTVILQLRMICNHGLDLLPPRIVENYRRCQADVSLEFDMDEECESCGHSFQPQNSTDSLSRTCPHVLCPDCSRGSARKKCPQSESEISMDCPLCYPEESDHPVTTHRAEEILRPHDAYKPSSKIRALMRNLINDQDELNSVKSVIFSCWTKMLDLVGLALDSKEIAFLRIDGSISLDRRISIIESFRNDKRYTILLASIGSAGVGLDLTVATRVHILEPQWNPMIEEQALDRVHRMGQSKDVVGYRYRVKDSIDEYIAAFQSKKTQLADMTFGTSSRAEAQRQRFEELKLLLR